jgi:hypothetical protein
VLTEAQVTSQDAEESVTILRFPIEPSWPNLTVVDKSVVDKTTYVTMINTFHNGDVHRQERFEITDASVSYIAKYSETTAGTATFRSQHTCLASQNALTSCVATMATTTQDAQPTTRYATMEFGRPLVLDNYWIAGSGITPAPARRSPDPADTETQFTKPTKTSMLRGT